MSIHISKHEKFIKRTRSFDVLVIRFHSTGKPYTKAPNSCGQFHVFAFLFKSDLSYKICVISHRRKVFNPFIIINLYIENGYVLFLFDLFCIFSALWMEQYQNLSCNQKDIKLRIMKLEVWLVASSFVKKSKWMHGLLVFPRLSKFKVISALCKSLVELIYLLN